MSAQQTSRAKAKSSARQPQLPGGKAVGLRPLPALLLKPSGASGPSMKRGWRKKFLGKPEQTRMSDALSYLAWQQISNCPLQPKYLRNLWWRSKDYGIDGWPEFGSARAHFLSRRRWAEESVGEGRASFITPRGRQAPFPRTEVGHLVLQSKTENKF